MAARYKIRVRIQPIEVTGFTEATQDLKAEEQRLLVPVDGSQTIGDLYYEIRRIYNELYNKSGELRIRCLETEDGELLHTSLQISDCFERRIDSNVSSQWTVIVRRQAPTAEELAEYKRNVRQLSFDDGSFVRPQFPLLEIPAVAPQEVSASPMRNRLTIREPVQEDQAEDVIPSTERDVEQAEQSSAVRQPQTSPTLVPNSQEALNGLGDSHNTMQAKTTNTQVRAKVPTLTKTKMPRKSKPLAPRKDIYDIDTISEQVQASRKMSPEQQLPENRASSIGRPSVPLDDRVGLRKAHPSGQKTPSIEPDMESRSRDNNNGNNSKEDGTDKSTAKLSAGIVETQKLVATLPTTPSSRRTQKLTPFFPHSATKLTSGSSQNESVLHATNTGIEVSHTEKPSITKSQQSQTRFASDRFKEADRRALSALQSKEVPNGKGHGETSLDSAKTVKSKQPTEALSTKEVANISESEGEVVEKPQRPILTPPVEKSHDESDVSEDDRSISGGNSKDLNQKPITPVTGKRKRGRPPGTKNKATLLKDTSKTDGSPSNTSSSSKNKKSEDEQTPPKKKRGRPVGSKTKAVPDRPKTLLKLDANGQPAKGRRGRPPGSKNKNKQDNEQGDSPKGNSKSSLKTNTEKIDPEESDVDDDTKSIDTDLEADMDDSTNKAEFDISAKTNVRKRKADNENDPTISKPSKRTKTTTDSLPVANADAMDESEDRPAVIAAANSNREESAMRSYSRSPAKEVNTSSSEESYDTDTASETSEQTGSATSSVSRTGKPNSVHHKSDSISKTDSNLEAKMTRSEPSKTSPIAKDMPNVRILSPLEQSAKKTKMTSNSPANSESGDGDENQSLPKKSRLPSSSADQAAAQLQSEDSQSMTTSARDLKKASPVVLKRHVPSSLTSSKYPSFKQYSQSIRTNPEFDQKMRQHPKTLQSLTDDSSSSSGSDSDSEDAAPKKSDSKAGHSKRSLKGFRGLLNRKPNK